MLAVPGRGAKGVSDRERWERRYQDGDNRLHEPEPSAFLARSLPLLPSPGRCLDLGGGQGRNALFLAQRGWDVTMIDVALAGVARARSLARARSVPLAGAVADLETGGLSFREASLDLVLMINYHDPTTVVEAAGWLKVDGALIVQGFAHEQLGRASGGPQNPEYLWRPNQLLDLATPLRVVWYEDRLAADEENPRHPGPRWVVRLIARRTA
jgi:SAM-dependent methyltransferase